MKKQHILYLFALLCLAAAGACAYHGFGLELAAADGTLEPSCVGACQDGWRDLAGLGDHWMWAGGAIGVLSIGLAIAAFRTSRAARL